MLNKEKGFVNILVIILVVLGIVFWVVSSGGDDTTIEDVGIVEMNDEKEKDVDMDMEEEMDYMPNSEEIEMSAGFFKDYESMEMLASGPENQVLFFHATWCPSCRALENNLSNNDIPSDLGIYKLDYDSSTELKKKYAVNNQHTLVQVDSEGNMINKWLGGNDIDSIVRNLK